MAATTTASAQPPRATPATSRLGLPSHAGRGAPQRQSLPALSDRAVDATTPDEARNASATMADGAAPDELAMAFSQLLYDVIPRRYEKKKDWGRQKRITIGLTTSGSGLDLRIRRRKKEVNHGTWKHYRVAMIEPEENLYVRVKNLRSLRAGCAAFTVVCATRLAGWAQARVYNRGIHLITLTAEGNTALQLWLDCEVDLQLRPSSLATAVAVCPRVTDARLDLEDFQLTRLSKVDGPLVRELGNGLRWVIEEELDGPKLVARLNRAIEKRRDRLTFSPAQLLRLDALPPFEDQGHAKSTTQNQEQARTGK